ncbi:MAG TPA: hypothetical protein DCZ61_03820 [Lachnospiraceae bacterium]|nr:hypothetical protein [Lachnospiraceae bacterium]
MNEPKRGRIHRLLFVLLVTAIAASGLIRTVFFPKDVNTYESRMANKPEGLTVESFGAGAFQDAMEEALADQVPFSQYFKKVFNILRFQYQRAFLMPAMARDSERCFHYNGIGIIDGYMIHEPFDVEKNKEIMHALAEKRVEDVEECRQLNPKTEYYLFYVESDRDYDFETGKKLNLYHTVAEGMKLPENKTGRLCIEGMDDYRKIYFKTDHHWNCFGAYEGYRKLMTLLEVDEPLLEPVEVADESLWWSGSKAAEVGFREYKEPFPVCRYDYPSMEIYINGNPSESLEPQDLVFAGELDSISYGNYYGDVVGEVILNTNRPERRNILLLGDSFDNAIRKLVASHFNKTFSVDERVYEEDLGKPFNLASYVKENNIDVVVYDGDILLFSGEAYLKRR